MKIISVLFAALMLSGCGVTLHPARPLVQVEVQMPLYPEYADAYRWDSRLNLYFFWHRGERFYMPKYWKYDKFRSPYGKYRGRKEFGHWKHF